MATSGGTHAVWVAFDTTSTPGGVWPFWTAAARPDVVVSLSGAYDFSERAAENYQERPNPLPGFQKSVENYTTVCNLQTLKNMSPVSLVPNLTDSNFKWLYFIDSQEDEMPHHQIGDLLTALQTAGIDDSLYFKWTIPHSTVHAFNYWHDRIRFNYPQSDPTTVADNVIAFLDDHLKNPP